MKTLSKIKAIGLSLLLTGALLTGCKKDDVSNVSGASSSQGYKTIRGNFGSTLTVRLVNSSPAPAFKEVNVSIKRIDVLYENTDPMGWLTVSETPRIVNLQDLKNTLLLDNAKVFMGKIAKIRLVLGTQNSLLTVIGGERAWFQLRIPVMYEPGVEVIVNAAIASNSTNVITLDFEANASISNEGDGIYILNPIIKTKRGFLPPEGSTSLE